MPCIPVLICKPSSFPACLDDLRALLAFSKLLFSSRISTTLRAKASGVLDSWLLLISLIKILNAIGMLSACSVQQTATANAGPPTVVEHALVLIEDILDS